MYRGSRASNKLIAIVVVAGLAISTAPSFAQRNTIGFWRPSTVVSLFLSLLAGDYNKSEPGNFDGPAASARFNNPFDVAVDSAGNVYVADWSNNLIRKITPAGLVSTLAGSGNFGSADGTGAAAEFSSPTGLDIDGAGNLYVADMQSHLIRKVTPAGVVTTLAGSGSAGTANGTGAAASFDTPNDVAVDSLGNVYVADANNSVIRKVTSGGVVTTFAGSGTPGSANGTGTAAQFSYPAGIAVNSSDDILVADTGNYLIRKITPAGVVTTLAGTDGVRGMDDGTGTAATFSDPLGLAIDSSGVIFVADSNNNLIRKVTSAGVVTTLAGSGSAGTVNGTGAAASFNYPAGVAVDGSGNLYVADVNNHNIRKITSAGVVTSFAGGWPEAGNLDATGAAARFYLPAGLAANSSGNVYVADAGNNLIRMVTPSGVTTTVAGSGGNGNADGTGAAAEFYNPTNLTLNSAGDLYVSDSGNHTIRKITTAGVVTTLAGNGVPFPGSAPTQYGGYYSVVNSAGDVFVAADTIIIKVTPGGVITTFANSMNGAYGIAIDGSGNLYVSEYNSDNITKITSGGSKSLLAGCGTAGFANGTGAAACFNSPRGLAVDASGNVFVADGGNRRIRKITPAGVVTTLAGSGTQGSADGTGAAASFDYPEGIAVDSSGNVFVADNANHIVRKVTSAGVVTTLAGTAYNPYIPQYKANSSVVDSSGNVFVADSFEMAIIKVTPAGVASQFAGSYGKQGTSDGTGFFARFGLPEGLAIDSSNNIYVADSQFSLIRKITPAGVVTTLAGSGVAGTANGTGAAASFNFPKGLGVDSAGNVFVADTTNHVIRKITPGGVVTTFAGGMGIAGNTNATGTSARFSSPTSAAVDSSGNVYVNDTGNFLIRKITSAGVVTTLAGSGSAGSANGTGTAASFEAPYGYLSVDSAGNVYVADSHNNKIRKITPAGVVTTIAGSGTPGSSNGTGGAASFSSPRGVAIDASNNLYIADTGNSLIRKITSAGVTTTFSNLTDANPNGTGAAAQFYGPSGVTVSAGGDVFVSDSGRFVRKITSAGVVTTHAGGDVGNADGTGGAARFSAPVGLSIDSSSNIFVTDNGNYSIRKVTSAGVVTTFSNLLSAGASPDGTGSAAQFNNPGGLAVDSSGDIFVADTNEHRIRKVTPAGVVTTFAGNGLGGSTDGTGTAATFNRPTGIVIDSSGHFFVTDTDNNLIRKITPAGVVTTFAGNGNQANTDGTGTAAEFAQPTSISIDASDNLFVSSGNLVRKITPAGVVTTVVGNPGLAITQTGPLPASLSDSMGLSVGAGKLFMTTGNGVLQCPVP